MSEVLGSNVGEYRVGIKRDLSAKTLDVRANSNIATINNSRLKQERDQLVE